MFAETVTVLEFLRKEKRKRLKRLTIVQPRVSHESLASWTFQAGVGGGSSVADALQVVMPEGRTPGRHDGRDAEVRRFSPLSLRRHPFSRARRRHSCPSFGSRLLPASLRQNLQDSHFIVSLSWRKVREKSPHPHSRRDIANDPPGPILDPRHLGSSFRHQVLHVRIDMIRGDSETSRTWDLAGVVPCDDREYSLRYIWCNRELARDSSRDL